MKTFLLVFMLAFMGATNGSAQKQSVSEQIMQGTWLVEGSGDGKSATGYLEWSFDNGRFTLNGYPQVHQEGSYRILKSRGDKLTLELFDQKGSWGTKKSQMEIAVDTRNDRLTIKDKGPFRRVIKKEGSY